MKIEILFRAPMRGWQLRLAEKLRAAGHQLRCVAGARPRTLPFAVGPALAFEKRLFGPAVSLFDHVSPPPDDGSDAAVDLVILLDGEARGAGRQIETLFDGAPGDAALLAMLAGGASPRVRVQARLGGETQDVVSAILAIEDRDVLSRAIDQALRRVVTLIVQAVRRVGQDLPVPCPTLAQADATLAHAPPAQPLIAMARGVARKIAGRLPGGDRGPSHWRIGYRHVTGAGVAEAKGWPAEAFTILPDDGRRFQADPMPFEHDGRTYLFFEDYPYATGKGVIGLVEIAADGTASSPCTILEQPHHLSYPLILRHGGEIYMLPEMSAAGRIQLFRADPFPDRWVPDRILIEGCIAGDATPVLHDGRWWMFATLSDDGGSTWDQLGLFHAPDLFGPWTPHADNPVLVDAGAARPAGALWHEDGVLMRVAQDCRGGYGRGLAICRVDQLDEAGYAQTIVAQLEPPDGQGADGVHTLCRTDGLEVIDLRFSSARRVRARLPRPAAHPEAARD